MVSVMADHADPLQAAKQWFEQLQRARGAFRPFPASRDWVDAYLRALPPDFREAARPVWEARFGKTIAEVQNELMAIYLGTTARYLTGDEAHAIRHVLFALYPTYAFEAHVGDTPVGGTAVILHEAIGNVIAFWCHLFTRLSFDGGFAASLFHESGRMETIIRFLQMSWQGSGANNPDVFGVYPTDADSWALSEHLCLSAIAFVIAHEIGHIVHGDAGYTANRAANHRMEFAADRFGLRLCIRRAMALSAEEQGDNYVAQHLLLGPFVALAVIALYGEAASDTHPSIGDRIDSLVAALETEIVAILGPEQARDWITWLNPDLTGQFRQIATRRLGIVRAFRQVLEAHAALRPEPGINLGLSGSSRQPMAYRLR